MKKHRELSRAGSEQKFKGGLADTSEKTTRLHTAHHLLLKALQQVLGAGSPPARLQYHSRAIAYRLFIRSKDDQGTDRRSGKDRERKIHEELPVIRSTLPKEQAEKLGAEHEFGAKYPDMVSVYSVGPIGATQDDPKFAQAFSLEFCGGPHVQNTSELAHSTGSGQAVFRIQKEEAVASGIRRIKATLA